jgi:hypothetical protein
MRDYTELLRQYGLVSSAGEAGDSSALSSVGHLTNFPPRQVIQMQMYETWSHVISIVREYIKTLYVNYRAL